MDHHLINNGPDRMGATYVLSNESIDSKPHATIVEPSRPLVLKLRTYLPLRSWEFPPQVAFPQTRDYAPSRGGLLSTTVSEALCGWVLCTRSLAFLPSSLRMMTRINAGVLCAGSTECALSLPSATIGNGGGHRRRSVHRLASHVGFGIEVLCSPSEEK